MVARAGYSVRTVNDLRAIPSSVLTQDSVRFLGEKEAWYYFAPGSTEGDDGDTVIAPASGTGRWKRQLVLGGSSGESGGDGGSNPDLTDLQNRVTTLEGQTVSLSNQASSLEFNKLDTVRFKDTLKLFIGYTQGDYTASGIYDAGTNTTTFYAPGFSATFIFKAALSIDGSMQYQPVSIEYIDASLVPPSQQNGFNPHVKIVVNGNISTARIFTEVVNTSALGILVDEAYNAAGYGGS